MIGCMISKTFRVTGRVQGVGFRWAAQEEAKRLNLAGWIQNDESGSVSGLVQGPQLSVEQFTLWLRRGSRSARVDEVETFEATASGLRNFTAR